MAYGSDRGGGDPRGPLCPGCDLPILEGQPRTLIHHPDASVYWHGECSRPIWGGPLDMLMRRLGRGWSS